MSQLDPEAPGCTFSTGRNVGRNVGISHVTRQALNSQDFGVVLRNSKL